MEEQCEGVESGGGAMEMEEEWVVVKSKCKHKQLYKNYKIKAREKRHSNVKKMDSFPYNTRN